MTVFRGLSTSRRRTLSAAMRDSVPHSSSIGRPYLCLPIVNSQGALGRIVREADPAIVDEADKPIPAPEHVVDRLGDRGRARQAGALLTQPCLQGGQNGCASFLAHAQAFFGAQAVDVALDVEQRVNALDCLQRIDALFDIERNINGLSAEERLRVRQERSAPILAALEAWLGEERSRLSRSASVAKPIDYM